MFKMSASGTSWPVIIHQGMCRSEFAVVLQQKQLKVRISERIIPGSVIFPLSGVAFIIVPLSQVFVKDENTKQIQLKHELTTRLDKFVQVHRNCYMLCQATLHGNTEKTIFSMVQRKYLNTRLNMMPVHNVGESVKMMLTIAESLCKPMATMQHSRQESTLREHLSDDNMSAALKQLGLSDHQCQVIADGLGSLSQLVAASRQELEECSLDSNTAIKIHRFFNSSEP